MCVGDDGQVTNQLLPGEGGKTADKNRGKPIQQLHVLERDARSVIFLAEAVVIGKALFDDLALSSFGSAGLHYIIYPR